MTWLILGVLTLVLVVIIMTILIKTVGQKKSSGTPRPPPPPRDLANLTIVDARVGDAISIHGAGDDFDDLQFDVDRRNRYESGEEEWFEVSGKYRGRRVFVEYYEDDVLEVSAVVDPQRLTLDDLGLAEEDLIRMDEEQSRSNRIEHDGQEWTYAGSQEIGYFRDGRGDGEGYYSWEFEGAGAERLLCIEKWEGAPFEVLIARKIHPDDVRVFRA